MKNRKSISEMMSTSPFQDMLEEIDDAIKEATPDPNVSASVGRLAAL